MRSNVPSLIALQMFEATARHQSFTRAAEELSITQSAVCRQVGALESRLRVALFVRSKRRLLLTEHGEKYAVSIRASLDRIERDTLELTATRGVGHTLEIAVTPMFASHWLIPRLPQLRVLHPDITVNLAIRNRRFLFEEAPFDAAVHLGLAQWSNAEGFRVMGEGDLLPVCAPALMGNARSLTPSRLARLPLLHLATRVDAWRLWFAATDADNDHIAVKGARYEMFALLASAAVAGMGVALASRWLVEGELASGRLVVASERSLPGSLSYFVARPAQRDVGPALHRFLSWLQREANAGLKAE